MSGTPTAAATAAAELTAQRAGVTLRELHGLDEMHEACRVLDRIWRPDPGNPLITPELLRVFAHSGSYVVGVDRGGRMVGFCLGFLASAGLHSHIAGVDDSVRGRNVGFAVKQHQRAWALARDITTITWTFDPLISRNAYFNLTKLGAEPSEYLADFYGTMQDEVNAGTETDRLLVRWELTGEHAAGSAAGTPAPSPPTSRAPARWSPWTPNPTDARPSGAGTATPSWSGYPPRRRNCAGPTRPWPANGATRCARYSAA